MALTTVCRSIIMMFHYNAYETHLCSSAYSTKADCARRFHCREHYSRRVLILFLFFCQGNILVTDDGEACLCDFGLSFILELAGPSSMTSAFCGSVRWMAPELVYSDPLVFRSASTDVYSFGAVAYQVCTRLIKTCRQQS